MSKDLRDLNSQEYLQIAEDAGIHYDTNKQQKWFDSLDSVYGRRNIETEPTNIELCGDEKEPICNLIDASEFSPNPRQQEAIKKILEIFKYELYEPLGNKAIEYMIYQFAAMDTRDWNITNEIEAMGVNVEKDLEKL